MSGTPAELLFASLRDYLQESVQPQLSGFDAYNNRVAANLLAILEREQALGASLQALDQDFAAERGLSAEDVPRSLALALREGRACVDEALLRYLRRRALLTMAIDNPRYSGYEQARERWREEQSP